MLKTSKIIFSAICFFILTFNVNISQADSIVLVDFDSEKTLFHENASHITPVSLKLITIYLAFEALNTDKIKLYQEFKVLSKALNVKGPKMFLEANKNVKFEDLLKGLIIVNANDALIMLSEILAKNEQGFIKIAQNKIKELGLNNSNFYEIAQNTISSKNIMSINDLATLSKLIIKKFPEYYGYFSEKSFTYNNVTHPNYNYLLNENGIDGLQIDGSKNNTFILSSIKNDKRLIAVLNSDELSEEKKLEKIKNLFSSNFANNQNKVLFKVGETITTLKVWHGEHNKIDLISEKEIIFSTQLNSIDLNNIKIYLNYENIVFAPINEGQILGSLVIKSNDIILLNIPLIAKHKIEEASFIKKMFQNAIFRVKSNLGVD